VNQLSDKGQNFDILLAKFKNGDQRAFDEIYHQCYRQVQFICSKLCKNKEDVEELVQDTFVVAFKKADTLRGDTLLALLRKIAAFRCYNKYKSNKHKINDITYLDDRQYEVKELDRDFLPYEYLQNKELQSELLQIINDLPSKQRAMIYLYYYADINTEQIALLYNMPSNNVRNNLTRARKTIKDKIEGRDKTAGMQRMAGVSPASVLLIEEHAFVAAYSAANIAAFSATTTAAVAATATTAGSIAGIVTAIVGVVAISALVYMIQPHEPDEYEITEPDVVASAPLLENDPITAIEQPIEYYEEYTEEAEEDVIETEYEYIPEETTEYEYTPQEEYIPAPVEEPPIEEDEPETYIPHVYEYASLPPPPEPDVEYVDMTPEILEALAYATDSSDVYEIITRYGFVFATQMDSFLGDSLRFYVLNNGNGEILVGISSQADGSEWRMVFEHFSPGQRPHEISDLFLWVG